MPAKKLRPGAPTGEDLPTPRPSGLHHTRATNGPSRSAGKPGGGAHGESIGAVAGAGPCVDNLHRDLLQASWGNGSTTLGPTGHQVDASTTGCTAKVQEKLVRVGIGYGRDDGTRPCRRSEPAPAHPSSSTADLGGWIRPGGGHDSGYPPGPIPATRGPRAGGARGKSGADVRMVTQGGRAGGGCSSVKNRSLSAWAG